jgi:prephenate dehydrogenase
MIKNPIIGIIGGTGLMGQWFKRFFENQGYTILIASRTTKLNMEDCAKQSDVVIISVPIDVTVETIKKVAPLVKKDSLLMDMTSLKVEPVKTMLKYSVCSVVGTHPMFGPGVEKIRNQKVVVCPGRGKKWQKWLINVLKNEGASIKIATPAEHDKMMSVIQGVMHFSSITISHVLKELKIDIFESQDFSSPIYKLRMDMVGRILNQDPKLYADIEIGNPKTMKALKTYLKTSKKLYNVVKQKNTNEFIKYFNEAADYLGDFKKEAEDYSNYVINKLVYKKNYKPIKTNKLNNISK